MKTAVKPDLKSKSFCLSKSYTPLIKKETSLVNYKYYQNLIVLLISFSIILIFPESTIESGNICESYNSRQSCYVW